MDFQGFSNRIRELGTAFEDYTKRRESLFQQNWNRQTDALSISRAGADTNEQLKDAYDELHARLGELCAEYLVMKERESARELVGLYPDLLRQLTNHLGWSVRGVRSKSDETHLMRGLAAISLGDLRTDDRDLLQALGHAYISCYRAGVPMSVPLARVAEISSSIPRGPGTTSTRELLLNFEESAHFKSAVSPMMR